MLEVLDSRVVEFGFHAIGFAVFLELYAEVRSVRGVFLVFAEGRRRGVVEVDWRIIAADVGVG